MSIVTLPFEGFAKDEKISEGSFNTLQDYPFKIIVLPESKPRFDNKRFHDGLLHLKYSKSLVRVDLSSNPSDKFWRSVQVDT